MKVAIKDNQTGKIVYQCEAEGDPLHPKNIVEGGSAMKEVKSEMNKWFKDLSDFAKRYFETNNGTGFYHIASLAAKTVEFWNAADNWNHYSVIREIDPEFKPPERRYVRSAIVGDEGLLM